LFREKLKVPGGDGSEVSWGVWGGGGQIGGGAPSKFMKEKLRGTKSWSDTLERHAIDCRGKRKVGERLGRRLKVYRGLRPNNLSEVIAVIGKKRMPSDGGWPTPSKNGWGKRKLGR